ASKTQGASSVVGLIAGCLRFRSDSAGPYSAPQRAVRPRRRAPNEVVGLARDPRRTMRLEHGSRRRWPTAAAACTFAAVLACGDYGTAGDSPPLGDTTTAVKTNSTNGTPPTTRASGTTAGPTTTGIDDTAATSTTGTSDGLDPRDGRWVGR